LEIKTLKLEEKNCLKIKKFKLEEKKSVVVTNPQTIDVKTKKKRH
jgi:hypothetical protein